MHRDDLTDGTNACRREISVPFRVTISPGATSDISVQPNVLSAQVSEATAYPPSGNLPTDIGRKPHGSRTAITRSSTKITSEYAPVHDDNVRAKRSSHVAPPAEANISVITSVSDDAVRPKPFASNSERSSCAFTKLPL